MQVLMMKIKNIKIENCDLPLPKIGDVIMMISKSFDRKIFMEVVNIRPELVLVKKVILGKWASQLQVKQLSTNQIITANTNSFRQLTEKEQSLLNLEKKLPEIEGIFI